MFSTDPSAPPDIRHTLIHIILWASVLAVLFLISRHNFLLFHTLAELFAVAVGWSVLLLVWNTRSFLRNDALLFLGLTYFFVTLLDLTHTLAYRGMNIFPDAGGANLATQLWISARSLEAAGLFVYSLMLGRSIPLWLMLSGPSGVTLVAFLSIFAWEIFPTCHVEGLGLTQFKIAVEYAVCLLLAAAMLNLTRQRDKLEPGIFHLLIMSMLLTMMAEVTFTLYKSVFGLPNVVGHYLKILSYFLIYLALVRFALKRPYHSLFRQLAQEREALLRNDRVHQARSRLISHARSLSVDELMTVAIDEVELLTDSRIGFFHTVDADQSMLTLQGWSTRTVKEMCSIPGRGLHYSVDQAGVWMDAVRQRKGVIHNDYPTLAHKKGLPGGHAPITRELVVPVYRDDLVVAILGVGNKPADYSEEDLDAASKLADLLWDIVERKRAEEAMRQSEERLALALEVTNDGLWDWDCVSGKAYFSPHYYAMLGYEPGEFEASYAAWQGLIHPDELAAVEEHIARHVASGQVFEIEFRMKSKSGQWLWIMGRGRVVEMNEQGRAARMVGTHVDVTARKNAEYAALRAKEAAEAANAAKSEFLANMSHEIRTPLNGIMGMLQLLQTTSLNQEQLEYSAMAVQSTSRLTSLLSDILDLSRVEAGKMPLRPEVFDLRKKLQQSMDLFTPIALQSGITLRHHFDETLPQHVIGDPIRLQQVITNLVGNAFKFTQQGVVSVEAYPLPARSEDQLRIFFEISDTGCGIPDAALSQLFEPFNQVSQGYTRQYQGAGLGLSICKRLVGLMGGNMAISSEVGAGTSISFCVTLDKAHELPTREPAARENVASQAKRILVAEDDEVNLFAVRNLLTKSGHTVVTAHDGHEALKRFAEQEFDLVLMDIQMPGMDGTEATRRIRATERAAGKRPLPIIAMTAYAMSGDREKLLDKGMDGYVAKPFSIKKLMEEIQESVGRG